MIVGLALFTQLAAACAPQVAPQTLAAVIEAESGFESLMIEDNTARRFYAPSTEEAATALAERLIRRHHSIDLGLMQVNSTNLHDVGLTVRTAFDPCLSLVAGAHILEQQYLASSQKGGEQLALREALSRYNTGNARRGFRNGYVRQVEDAARLVQPALASGAAAVPQPARVPERHPVPKARSRHHVTLRGT